MFRFLAAAAVAIVVSHAAWAGTGTDICVALWQGYVACGTEALTTNANGQFKSECPSTISSMEGQQKQFMTKAGDKSEIRDAFALWNGYAEHIARSAGETKAAFTDRRSKEQKQLDDECEKLKTLD